MTVDEALFRATFEAELLEAWQALKAAHPDAHFYSFGVDIGACAETFIVTASTEEGLRQVADRYAERQGGDPVQHRVALRWFTADSPLHDSEQRFLARSRTLALEAPDGYDESPEADAWVGLVFDAAVQALAALDRRDAFGADIERARLVLSIWGDQPDDERLAFARELNPPVVVARFARELEDGHDAFQRLSRVKDEGDLE